MILSIISVITVALLMGYYGVQFFQYKKEKYKINSRTKFEFKLLQEQIDALHKQNKGLRINNEQLIINNDQLGKYNELLSNKNKMLQSKIDLMKPVSIFIKNENNISILDWLSNNSTMILLELKENSELMSNQTKELIKQNEILQSRIKLYEQIDRLLNSPESIRLFQDNLEYLISFNSDLIIANNKKLNKSNTQLLISNKINQELTEALIKENKRLSNSLNILNEKQKVYETLKELLSFRLFVDDLSEEIN